MTNKQKSALEQMEEQIKLLSDEMMERPEYKRLRSNMGLPAYEPYFSNRAKGKKVRKKGGAIMKARGGTFKGTF